MLSQFDEVLERRKKGSLKIYLGYAAGVGKTYSMLQEAQRLKSQGFDVVIGYIEPHDRVDTSRQIGDLEVVPKRYYTLGDRSYEEMDVAAVIKRQPQIALVDELAHTNAPGSKNEKRYQDILELLDHEISVISTMNVQHLEAVADKVTEVTGAEVRERVPDYILQRADQIVTVDVSIEELRERLRTGKIYKVDQAERALARFFTQPNLSMLRETALREAAGDQSRRIDTQQLLSQAASKVSHETLMICLSSDPTNAEILIRRGTKMATQLSSRCFVIYVQRKLERPTVIDSGLQRKIQNNLVLAKRLGAEVVTLQGENVAEVLVNFATENSVRHAVFGKSRLSPFRERLRGSIIMDFSYDAVGVDIHILSTVEAKTDELP
ncbi:MAG: kinase [Oligoflexia bacterium]|nr:kinase [Oligoflexia bacterium]